MILLAAVLALKSAGVSDAPCDTESYAVNVQYVVNVSETEQPPVLVTKELEAGPFCPRSAAEAYADAVEAQGFYAEPDVRITHSAVQKIVLRLSR